MELNDNDKFINTEFRRRLTNIITRPQFITLDRTCPGSQGQNPVQAMAGT